MINTVPSKRKKSQNFESLFDILHRVFKFKNLRKKNRRYLPTRFGKTRNSFLDPPPYYYLCQRVYRCKYTISYFIVLLYVMPTLYMHIVLCRIYLYLSCTYI